MPKVAAKPSKKKITTPSRASPRLEKQRRLAAGVSNLGGPAPVIDVNESSPDASPARDQGTSADGMAGVEGDAAAESPSTTTRAPSQPGTLSVG